VAFGIDDAITAASTTITTAINKIWPDPADRAKAEAITIQATADASLAQLRQTMSIALAEAQSADKWTSRARPSMMYVMYVMILCCLPMGVLWAVAPASADHIATGMQKWLAAIPDALWSLFQFCFLGYSASRSAEKIKGVAK